MRRAAPWLLVAALACSGGEPPPEPDLDEEVETTAKETFQGGGGINTASIAALTPVVPEREATTPVPLPKEERYSRTATFLRAQVQKRATDPNTPWTIGHGMIALGPDLVLSNGQPAVEHLFATYARRFEVDGHTFVRFPRKVGGTRVEPHAALMLKIFTESGVSPDRTVMVEGHEHTVADLYRGVLVGSAIDPVKGTSTFTSPNDMPWALQALATWAPEGNDLKWRASNGTQMSLVDLGVLNASVLMAESQPLFDTMQAGAALQKRGQGLFGFTCGGAHLLQGTAYAAGRGYTSELAKKGLQGQVALMFWRLSGELQVYDDLMRRIDKEEHMHLLLVQRLKFTGHFLETMHKMAILGFYQPTPEQQRVLQGAADQVVLTVKALDEQGVYKRIDAIRATNEQLYFDLVGDSAHALRGLELAMGTATLRY